MSDWIPFEEGSYRLLQTYLVSADQTALAIADAVVSVYRGRQGRLVMNGRALVRPFAVVRLLEESDRLDMLLDFGAEFKYLMESPELKAGKVFAPDVTSTLQFFPTQPWKTLTAGQFEQRTAVLNLID